MPRLSSVTLGGVRQYIQFLGRGVVGVDAKSGRFLWRFDETSNGVTNISTPIFHDGAVFSVASKQGAALVKLHVTADKASAEKVYFTPKLQTHLGGAVRVGDFVYATTGNKLVCMDFNTGNVKWENASVGKGSACYADGRLYVRSEESSDVALVEASPSAYKEHGRFTPPDRSSSKAWCYPIIANGRLYLRDQGVLQCYNVMAAKPGAP
jgi:outer membrane protein assembly factor BamB